MLLSQAVDSTIRLALLADEAADSQRGELASHLAVGVEVSHVQLDRSVVVTSDETVGGRAKTSGGKILADVEEEEKKRLLE